MVKKVLKAVGIFTAAQLMAYGYSHGLITHFKSMVENERNRINGEPTIKYKYRPYAVAAIDNFKEVGGLIKEYCRLKNR